VAKAKIYIASPIWRYLDVRTAYSILKAICDAREPVFWETLDGDALISRSRSQLATKFLQDEALKEADVMVIIDDDIEFENEDFWKIVNGAREKNAPYGGIYVTRSREPHTAALGFVDQEIDFGPEAEAAEIRYLATGFMAIPRKVFEDMLEHPGFETCHGKEPVLYCTQGVGDKPMWDFFRCFTIYEPEENPRVHYLSEDWAFSERARQCGYKIWADPSILLRHRAVVSVTVADLVMPGHAISEGGAPSKDSRTMLVSSMGSTQEDNVLLVGES
jgi:hypothetical protein